MKLYGSASYLNRNLQCQQGSCTHTNSSHWSMHKKLDLTRRPKYGEPFVSPDPHWEVWRTESHKHSSSQTRLDVVQCWMLQKFHQSYKHVSSCWESYGETEPPEFSHLAPSSSPGNGCQVPTYSWYSSDLQCTLSSNSHCWRQLTCV